jgi:hypothetical protein
LANSRHCEEGELPDEAIYFQQCGDCFGKNALAMTKSGLVGEVIICEL